MSTSLEFISIRHCNLMSIYLLLFTLISVSLENSMVRSSNASDFSNINQRAASMVFKREPKGKRIDVSKGKYPFAVDFTYPYYRMYDKACNTSDTFFDEKKSYTYELSILAMFKNEAQVMREWLDHHIGHGVQHFFLVDDQSTDNVTQILNPYIKAGYVTMFHPPHHNVPFRQSAAYKKVFLDIYSSRKSHWVAIIDLDEFLFSPRAVDIRTILREHSDLSVAGINWVWFGSNGYIEQPTSVIQSFTMRADYNSSKYPKLLDHYKVLAPRLHATFMDWQKNIINCDFKVDSVDVHKCLVEGLQDNLSYNRYPDNPPLLLNHYSIQSKNFFLRNKGARGDINNWVEADARNLEWFEICDINDVKDTRLAEQNKKFGIAIRN